ncbi:MAG: putative tyrosine recombinase XerC-like protein [Candidatus Methanofastidiosum methylothiophilum]|uniref:Putative tyrosine recombinase XerC-like protein n=1 Tax=Candidatus Methanofastidiosum methylothiophilum TaxID=1705564 RepID=A0A150J0V8_9EURY|nr:MAG: putative tyrosine recombinase XerC-like protein [Candidatus Methanofastidiosum methylthiophilus]KYC50857.1 MAG: putative tyrosine recombinase XerC-like protein [Candidatus Methanofastidiosum methylthiophilus]
MGIYKEKALLSGEEGRLIKSEISESNVNLVREFKSYLIASRIGILRTVRYMLDLRLICQRYKDKDFRSWTSKDIIEVLEKIEVEDLSDSSKNEYRRTLTKFFKWLKGDDWPDLKALKGDRKHSRKPQVLAKEEILQLIEGAKHPRDKAAIALLYDCGLRVGELASITFKDLVFNDYGGKVKVRGKTGERLVPFVMAEPYIKNWVQIHPNPAHNEPLFVGTGNKNFGKPLFYESYQNIIKRAVKKSGIQKKVTPHIIRHTRATHLASKLTESEMCHYLGWQLGSDMPKVYVHLSGRDIDSAIYTKVYGLKIDDGNKEDSIKPIPCPRCKENCGPSSEYCYRCGMPLKEEKIFDMEKKSIGIRKDFFDMAKDRTDRLDRMNMFLEIMDIVESDPEIKAKLISMTKK